MAFKDLVRRMTVSGFTRSHVAGFVRALPSTTYDLRIVDRTPGKFDSHRRTFTSAELLDEPTLAWLRARSADGVDVYCRPTSPRHVLVDDLDGAGLKDLEVAGIVAAAIVETSRSNHQAWFTLAEADDIDLTADLAFHTARILARRFGGDVAAANRHQVGRLPGFTNNKPKHLDEVTGKRPWVSLRHGNPVVTSGAAEILAEARRDLEATRAASLVADEMKNKQSSTHAAQLNNVDDPAAYYDAAVHRWFSLRGPLNRDRSALDFAIATRLVRQGHGDRTIAAVLAHSEKAQERGGPRQTATYIDLTIANARRDVAASSNTTKPAEAVSFR